MVCGSHQKGVSYWAKVTSKFYPDYEKSVSKPASFLFKVRTIHHSDQRDDICDGLFPGSSCGETDF